MDRRPSIVIPAYAAVAGLVVVILGLVKGSATPIVIGLGVMAFGIAQATYRLRNNR